MVSEAQRAHARTHEEKLVAAGVRKVTFRLPAATRHALRAYAMTRGLSENAAAILAVETLTKEPS